MNRDKIMKKEIMMIFAISPTPALELENLSQRRKVSLKSTLKL